MRLLIAAALLLWPLPAQQMEDNYDETKVGAYTLPDPLVMQNGDRVRDAQMWWKRRRPELLALFESQVYGRTVPPPQKTRFEVLNVDDKALGGKAVRKQIRAWFGRSDGPRMDILLYIPSGASGRVPVFVGLNFGGNHTVDADPGIRLPDVWQRDPKDKTVRVRQPALESQRGRSASQWQVETILARGYALATAYYEEIEPDFYGGMPYSVRSLSLGGGQTDPKADEWGAIGAWAWGLSRIVDYLQTDQALDSKKIALMGHSRLGKAALWAGAQDTRFGIVISNESGEGGAALARRNFGETLMRINAAFPHWFCLNYREYGADPGRMPVDQHELLALIAPRPLYIASAAQDLHSDPKGEFLAGVAAGPVYELLGKKGLGETEPPPLNQAVGFDTRYHNREGGHDVTAYDWEQYLSFADKYFK